MQFTIKDLTIVPEQEDPFVRLTVGTRAYAAATLVGADDLERMSRIFADQALFTEIFKPWGDFDNDILADLTGLSGLSSTLDNTTPADDNASAPVADATDKPAPIDFNSDINLEMSDEQIHSTLREKWGENYDDNFAAASRIVAEIFHGDDAMAEWFAQRLGNHVNVVLIANRSDAMLNGARPARATVTPPVHSKSLDDRIAEFSPGDAKHEP
jgi:hypothetical protein